MSLVVNRSIIEIILQGSWIFCGTMEVQIDLCGDADLWTMLKAMEDRNVSGDVSARDGDRSGLLSPQDDDWRAVLWHRVRLSRPGSVLPRIARAMAMARSTSSLTVIGSTRHL